MMRKGSQLPKDKTVTTVKGLWDLFGFSSSSSYDIRYDEKALSTMAEEMETTENHWQPLAPTGTHWYTSTIGTHWNPLEPAGIHCTYFNPPKLEAPNPQIMNHHLNGAFVFQN